MLPIGTIAPVFKLHDGPDSRLNLAALRGKKVILAFYPADWSPVCGSQMNLYNEMEEYFIRYNAQLLGISVDSRWCHAAYSEQNEFYFPLLADFEPKGEVSKLYEAYDSGTGECHRALYVIDEDGIIVWNYLSLIDVNPGAEGILLALENSETLKNVEL